MLRGALTRYLEEAARLLGWRAVDLAEVVVCALRAEAASSPSSASLRTTSTLSFRACCLGSAVGRGAEAAAAARSATRERDRAGAA